MSLTISAPATGLALLVATGGKAGWVPYLFYRAKKEDPTGLPGLEDV